MLNAQKTGASLDRDNTSAPPRPVMTGAYRPPGLRNREVPSIFKREDEGGAPYTPSKNGSDKPAIPGMMPKQNGSSGKGRGRIVPGAGPPSDSRGRADGKKQNGGKQVTNRKAYTDTSFDLSQGTDNLSLDSNGTHGAVAEIGFVIPDVDSAAHSPPPVSPATPSHSSLPNGSSLDKVPESPLTPEDKKRRALQKKLGAIEALKAKRAAGEKLEKTQEKKIDAEAEVKKELAEVGA